MGFFERFLMSKLAKLIFTCIAGLFLMLALTYPLWFAKPNLMLSFFMSGNGTPNVEVNYENSENGAEKIVIMPKLSSEPSLIKIGLNTNMIKKLALFINNYSGTLDISDVFVSGTPLSQIKVIPTEGINILNSSVSNILFSVNKNAQLNLCDNCEVNTSKQIIWLILGLIISIYLALVDSAITVYRKREKLKQKLLNVYTFKNY